MSAILASHLEAFKESESSAQLATVVDSPEAIKVIQAWTATRKTWKKAAGKAPVALELLWSWLWRGVKFDREALAEQARIAVDQSHYVLRALVAAKLVYPDGTITKAASELVDAYVGKRMIQQGAALIPKTATDPKSRECGECGAGIGQKCLMKNGKPYRKLFHHLVRRSDKR